MELTTLYGYYGGETIAPTFANLRDEAAVDAYAGQRERLLSERLALPRSFFRGADILEFGPDTGENALVFARWGAQLTLVEPARAAHAKIAAYFARFAPPNALRAMVCDDVLTYVADRRFDIIVAEGFIYTVQPSELWLRAFGAALAPGGLALISYIERSASLFELLLRVPFAALRRRDGCDRDTAAERLYRRKWDRIAHTRTFASWAMDVLDNPFMRLRYFLPAADLVREAARAGFGVHAAWPLYRDGLEHAWAKQPQSEQQRLERSEAHLRRSTLSFVFGTKAYLIDDAPVRRLETSLDDALAAADRLIEVDDADTARRLAAALREIAAFARSVVPLVDSVDSISTGIALLAAWTDVVMALADGRLDAAVRRLNEDTILLDGWGSPTHLAVLRYDGSAADGTRSDGPR